MRYLIVEKTGRFMFYLENPKIKGCKEIAEEVDFHYPDLSIKEKEKNYRERNSFCLGQSNINSKQYCVFASEKECTEADFMALGSDFGEAIEWKSAIGNQVPA